MTETTALILDECGVLTTYRGQTFVKGAGYIRTYFVPLDDNFHLIRKENSLQFYRSADRDRYYNIRNVIMTETDVDEVDIDAENSNFNVRQLSQDDSSDSATGSEIKEDSHEIMDDESVSSYTDSMLSYTNSEDPEIVITHC